MKKATPKARAARARDPLHWFRLRLSDGLKGRGSAAADHLHDVLERADLPALGGDDEPYEWILRALPEQVRERSVLVRRLARASAHLLQEFLDGGRDELFTKPVLYNLLFLVGNLHRPEDLGDVLLEIYKAKRITGTWEGFPMASALRIALAANQVDNTLGVLWRSMLKGKPDEYLRGRPLDGFNGVLWMPPSRDHLHEPSLHEIGEALRYMADYLEERETRRVDFRQLVDRVKSDYPERKSWNLDLAMMADAFAIPRWAVESLPSLYIEQLTEHESRVTLYIWEVMAPLLAFMGSDYEEAGAICSGVIRVLKVDVSLLRKIRRVAEVVESYRNALPFCSDRAVRGAALTGLLVAQAAEEVAGRLVEAAELHRMVNGVREQLFLPAKAA